MRNNSPPWRCALGVNANKVKRIPFDITDPRYMEHYFTLLHHPQEEAGVDFWWMDWQQGKTTAMPGLDTLPWINHLHWRDMERNPRRGGKRPLIFSRFGGYGAGRYCIGFSGDTYSVWESLHFQPYFTATAANVLYGYWSHDIGGHHAGRYRAGALHTLAAIRRLLPHPAHAHHQKCQRGTPGVGIPVAL